MKKARYAKRYGRRARRQRRSGSLSQAQIVAAILAYGPAQWIRFTADNVTLNAGAISAATDLSPNARNVSQVTSTVQPTFANPGADFDGTDDVLESGSAFLHGIAGSSFFSVIDLAGETLTGAGDSVYGLTTSNFYAMSFGALGAAASGTPEFGILESGVNRGAGGPASLSGATGRYLLDGRATSGSIRCWTNGVQGTENTDAWSGTITANRSPYVGGLHSSGGLNRPFPGTIQDVIVFTTALSLSDQAAVRALLAQLDGVTL